MNSGAAVTLDTPVLLGAEGGGYAVIARAKAQVKALQDLESDLGGVTVLLGDLSLSVS